MNNIFLILIIVGFANIALAEDWYSVDSWTGFENGCQTVKERMASIGIEDTNSPADVIRNWRASGITYKVIDEKTEGGKVVQVKLIDMKDGFTITFYYGLKRCEAAQKIVLKSKEEKERLELEKYK